MTWWCLGGCGDAPRAREGARTSSRVPARQNIERRLIAETEAPSRRALRSMGASGREQAARRAMLRTAGRTPCRAATRPTTSPRDGLSLGRASHAPPGKVPPPITVAWGAKAGQLAQVSWENPWGCGIRTTVPAASPKRGGDLLRRASRRLRPLGPSSAGTNSGVTLPPLQMRPLNAAPPSCSARSVSTPVLDAEHDGDVAELASAAPRRVALPASPPGARRKHDGAAGLRYRFTCRDQGRRRDLSGSDPRAMKLAAATARANTSAGGARRAGRAG